MRNKHTNQRNKNRARRRKFLKRHRNKISPKQRHGKKRNK